MTGLNIPVTPNTNYTITAWVWILDQTKGTNVNVNPALSFRVNDQAVTMNSFPLDMWTQVTGTWNSGSSTKVTSLGIWDNQGAGCGNDYFIAGAASLVTPAIAVTKTASANPLTAGSSATFTVNIAVSGGTTTTPIALSDVLPSGLTLSGTPSIIAGSTTSAGAALTCTSGAGATTASCTVASGAGTGNIAISIPVNVGANTASSITNTASALGGTANCTGTACQGSVTVNVAQPPTTLQVTKQLNGNRVNAADQFTVQILNGSTVVNSTANSTSLGANSDITPGKGMTGVTTLTPGTNYTINEVASGGANLSQYSAAVGSCNNTRSGSSTTIPLALGVPFQLQAGDAISCTLTNTPVLPTLTIKKITTVGSGAFFFNGTANANGFSTNGSYSVTTTAPNTLASGGTVTLAASNVLTEVQETVPSQWLLGGASCTDTNAAITGNPASFGALNGSTLRIAAGNVLPGANLQCTFTNTYVGLTLSGKIIVDTGAGSGTANDGVQNGTEPGKSGVALRLTDCANTVYASTTSGADGSFSLSLNGVPAGQPACLVEALPNGYSVVSANMGTTGGSYNAATATLRFTPTAGLAYSGVVVGNAPMSTLTNDGAQQTSAGGLVTYAHTYVAGTAGTVTFSTTDNPAPTGLIWSSSLYRDANCNGVLDSGDPLLTAPINVTAGQVVCLLDRVMTPAGATTGVLNLTTVNASESWSVPTLTPTTQTRVLKNVDTTLVGVSGLTLLKEVRKLSSCPADAAASMANGTAYASSGSASPGDALEYRLRYTNSTSAPLTAIVVHDQVPAYSRYVNGLCLTTPATGIAGCAVSLQPAVNDTSGAVAWTMSDSSVVPIGLQPSASGSVSFCIQVQQ